MFFYSGNLYNGKNIEKKLERLSKEEKVKLDDFNEIIEEAFNSIENKENEQLIYFNKDIDSYLYNKELINIFKNSLEKFIESYSENIIQNLCCKSTENKFLINNYYKDFFNFKKDIIDQNLRFTGFEFMNYEGLKAGNEKYYFEQIKNKILKKTGNKNFNFLNGKLKNDAGELSEEYKNIYDLGNSKNGDYILENISKIFEPINLRIALSISMLMARFEKEFSFDKLKPKPIELLEKDLVSTKFNIEKYSNSKNYEKILEDLKFCTQNYAYMTQVDIRPFLREGMAVSSYLEDKKTYNFFYMYAHYFGLIEENREEGSWRFDSSKYNSEIIKYVLGDNGFNVFPQEITDVIPEFWNIPKNRKIKYLGVKRSRLEILTMFYFNFDIYGKNGCSKKTEKDVLAEMKKAIDLDGNKNFINENGETALHHTLGEVEFIDRLSEKDMWNLTSKVVEKSSYYSVTRNSNIFKILGRYSLDILAKRMYLSYERTILLLDKIPEIDKLINSKSKQLKMSPLIALLNDFCIGYFQNRELYIKLLEKLIEKGADPNLTGRPEENTPLALLIRYFSEDFLKATLITNEWHVRESNKKVFPRYDNSSLDEDYDKQRSKQTSIGKEMSLKLSELHRHILKNNKKDLLKCCKILLDAGADLNLPINAHKPINDKNGLTLFHYIIEKGDMDLFNLVINYPIDFNIGYIPKNIGNYGELLVDGKIPVEKLPVYMNGWSSYRDSDSKEKKKNREEMSKIITLKKMSSI